jgi:hypothetical protein
MQAALPALLSMALFLVVVAAVLKAALRPLGKVALIVFALALLGILPVPVVRDMAVASIVFLVSTLQSALLLVFPA